MSERPLTVSGHRMFTKKTLVAQGIFRSYCRRYPKATPAAASRDLGPGDQSMISDHSRNSLRPLELLPPMVHLNGRNDQPGDTRLRPDTGFS